MAETPIEQLQLSVRARNVLRRMGIYSVEELLSTPIENIAQQRNAGQKTIDEIRCAIVHKDIIVEDVVVSEESSNYRLPENNISMSFSDEQLYEMSKHSITELGLSTRPYNILYREGYSTIEDVAQLSEADFGKIKKLGRKSAVEIQESIDSWIRENLVFRNDIPRDDIDSNIKAILQKLTMDLEPIVRIYWRRLVEYMKSADLDEQILTNDYDEALKEILLLPQFRKEITNFWESISNQGVITEVMMVTALNDLKLGFQPSILLNAALESKIITRYKDVFMLSRDTVFELFNKECDPNDRAFQILQLRVAGETFQDIGSVYSLTRERVRQICIRAVCKLPLLFEDYFHEPYTYFHLSKTEFCRAFPQMTEEGYEFLSIRYIRGKVELTSESLNKYTGLWKEQLDEYLCEKKEGNERRKITKTEMVMRVLISNADNPLSLDEFADEYYNYIERKDYPINRLKINLRSVGNYLRNSKGIVFNKNNKVRFCDADPHVIWTEIDFNQYKNTVISSELIFRDYQDIMEELDIRDGYELFYVIKSSLHMWGEEQFTIRCRRVPIIVMGDASEEMQAIRLLKELSPVTYLDYFEAYEERYGVRAQGNSVIADAVGAYYVDGKYVIDAPIVNENDVQSVCEALQKKPLWFIEDIENLFARVCKYTTHDAINAVAFRRMGYILNTSYAYDASYGTALNLFDRIVFSQDVVDLSLLDRRILNLGMFAAALDKNKKSLEYIETAPKILMSKAKVYEVYGLSVNEIREIQGMVSLFKDKPFFNGRSIWSEIENLSIIQKLQGNDWMLTCIMRQQEAVGSLSVAGGIILSLENTLLKISQICEWISSVYGVMTVKSLEKKFNEIFGTRIRADKIAEKLRTSGSWDKVVTDSMDEYIDNLVDEGISNMEVDDFFQEEFF